MAAIQSTKVSPYLAPAPQYPNNIAMVHRHVPEGVLSATWARESDMPPYTTTKTAAMDPRVTHYDYTPRYTSPASGEVVDFTPRFAYRWVLTGVKLWTSEAAFTVLCELREVVAERQLLPLGAVGPMRRSDRKLARREYTLDRFEGESAADAEVVRDVDVQVPGSRWARLTVANGTKYVLEMSWGASMSLVDAVDGSVDDGSSSDEDEGMKGV